MAEQHLASLLELRERVTETELLARIDIAHARNFFEPHNEFIRARELLTPYAEYMAGDAPFILKYRYFFTLGRIVLELGMAEESFNYFVQAADLAKLHERHASYSNALGNALTALRDQLDEFSDDEKREDALRLAGQVLENARETGSRVSELKAMIILAELSRDPEWASSLYSDCAALASEDFDDPDILIAYKSCRFALAEQVALVDPRAARRMVDELWKEVPYDSNFLENAYDKHGEMRVLWNTGSSEAAWDSTVEVLKAIEEVRDSQLERDGRSRSFSAWAMTYPWLAGRLLKGVSATGSELDLQRAFDVIEQMRARLLLDILEAMHVQRRDTQELRAKRRERLDIVEERNRLQRRLRVAAISESERRDIKAHLDRLRDREERLRARISRDSGVFADLEQPNFASVPEIQAALFPSEALLSFHLAPWATAVERFAGGSWLIALTTESATAYELPSEKEIEQRISVLSGLLEREDGAESSRALASRLYEDLLAEALSDLPPHITNLIVIPDKALHRLPFAALRPAKDAPPLATRYRFSRVPSATLWLRRWRDAGPPLVPSQPALVLADPASFEDEDARADGSQVASLMRDGDHLFRAESYGPLPFAQQEGWSVLRQLGPGTEMLTGFEASERYLKMAMDLDRFGILHFAAHAIANEEEPDRAGVLLAPDPNPLANGKPGDGIYDGMLQFNEIVDLRFKGRTVVLSTCHSARGQILRGEGVFDLARAFFEGGARAVVGSLWKLEDKATAEFFDDFYRHLARGVSLTEALHRAQKDQIDRGVPPSVWAGIVVIGDGSLVPVPSRKGRQEPFWPIALAVVLLLVAVAVAARRNP